MKKLLLMLVMSVGLTMVATGAMANDAPKKELNAEMSFYYQGYGDIYWPPLSVFLLCEFFSPNSTSTDIVGTLINGDFWVTDGYIYYVGGVKYANVVIYTDPSAYGTLYYDGPIPL